MKFEFERTRQHATSLIADGMRVALVQSISGIPRSSLLAIRKAIHGDVTTGRMPTDVVSYLKAGQSAAGLATVVAAYLANERAGNSQLDAFVTAWQTGKLLGMNLDVNAAWFAVRDIKAGLIGWAKCKDCAAWHFIGCGSKKMDACPFCRGRQKVMG